MKKIPLTHGQEAIVDDWWYDYLMQWRWYAHWSKNTKSYYAIRAEGSRRIFMHRVVMNTEHGMECDHIYHNTLDNRESELRNVTTTQNQMNKKVQYNNKLGIRGVHVYGDNGRYRAQLQFQGKFVLNKTFKTIEEAVAARRSAEKKFFGEFAFPHDDVS